MLYILFLFILFRFILSFSSIPLHIISSLILYYAEFIHLNILCLFVFFLSLCVILVLHASPSTVNWFKSYLSSRYQYVRIGSTHSDTLPITHGVPQGAILSPLLSCIYLNDLPLPSSSCNLESYVDHLKLFLSFPLIEMDAAIEKMEQDLLSVAQWCCENHSLINPDKTKLLFLGTRQMLNRLPL